MTLEQLQARREAILAEMGQPDMAFEDRSMKRRPQAELSAALAKIDAEIAALETPQRRRQVLLSSSKGL